LGFSIVLETVKGIKFPNGYRVQHRQIRIRRVALPLLYELMPQKPLDKLWQLAGQVVNLPTTEAGACQLSDLVAEAISVLTTLKMGSDQRRRLRCQVSRIGLQTEVAGYLEAYSRATDQREKVTRLTQARSQAHYLLWKVLRLTRP
jgi:hypothetical protein